MRSPAPAAAIGLALIAVALTGCSHGAKSASTGIVATTGQSASTNAGGSTGADSSKSSTASTQAAASGGSAGDLTRYCSAIKKVDAQALMKPDVGAVHAAIGECAFAGGKIEMDLYADPDKKYYGSNAGTSGRPLSGVGDEAIWYQPVAGVSAPWVDARKGTLTCSVSTPDDLSTSTLPFTGTAPFTKVADTDAAAYAQKVGLLCADVFTAAG